MNITLIADNLGIINPNHGGGAELSDLALCARLQENDIYVNTIPCSKFNYIDKDAFYIISNRMTLSTDMMWKLVDHDNYIIIEHGYPFVRHTNPALYKDLIVPEEHKINLFLYEHARLILFQTGFHESVYKKNKIPGKYHNMVSTLYSKEELELIRKLSNTEKTQGNKVGIFFTNNYGKNTGGAIRYCHERNLPIGELHPSQRHLFLSELAKYNQICFIPVTPESCCRYITEARMLNVEVITQGEYGANTSPWYSLSGPELITEINRLNELAIKEIIDVAYYQI